MEFGVGNRVDQERVLFVLGDSKQLVMHDYESVFLVENKDGTTDFVF